MEGSPAVAWRRIDGAPHGSSGYVLDQLKQNSNRKTRRQRNKRPIVGGAPELRTEASGSSEQEEIKQEEIQEEAQQEEEQEEIQEEKIQQEEQEQEEIQEEKIQQEEIQEEKTQQEDEEQEQEEIFSALLARRQQFVEEIRHKRIRPKKRFRPKEKKGCALVGLPSWLLPDADDNPMSNAVTTADLAYLNCEDEDNAEGSLHVAEEDKHGDKELLPSCAVQTYDVEDVDKIAETRCDLLTTLVEENTKEFFRKGMKDCLRPQPLLALDNVTHSCILTKTCYHRTYRTDDITETDPSYRELEPENMVQIFSLTLPETYPRSVSIYGTFAIRDVLHPGRNYLFRRSRDNSITIHPGSRLPLCSPCRGIYALTSALLDVDLWIKHEADDESADEKFVSGYFELMVNCKYDVRFRQRLHDGIRSHVLDVDGRYIGWSIAATVIASVDVPYPCQVTFTAYTSGFDDEVTIFDSTCHEGETVEFRHVVAVKVLWTLKLCLKLDGVLCYSHSFKAGVDSRPIKFGPGKALVVWSVMNRHRFWW